MALKHSAMRKALSVLLLASSFATAKQYTFTGHSFFSIRAPFQSGSPEKEALWHYDWLDRGDCSGTVEVVPFGGESVLSRDEFDHFFTPRGRIKMHVTEYKPGVAVASDLNRKRGLEARHFNIETRSRTRTFQSDIELFPKHKYVAVGIAYRQRFWCDYWWEISAPIMRVENSFEFCEHIIDDGGGAVDAIGLSGQPRYGSMRQAFESKAVRFGRIAPSVKREKTGLGDIELKIGWDTYNNGEAHLRSYIGAVIATGNKPNPEYLFPAVVGNNKHNGVLFGSNIGFPIWQCGEHLFRHEIDVAGRYLFSNHQCRVFDIYDKQWSRYMEAYQDRAQARQAAIDRNPNSGVFGPNVFTHTVRVLPKFSTVFNTAYIYEYCNKFLVEGGYNFFARQGEEIEFPCEKGDINDAARRRRPLPALKDVNGGGFTTQARTIDFNFPQSRVPLSNYESVGIAELDRTSAAHPPVISQTFYGAVGYRFNEWCYPTMFSLGGSYEFSGSNGAMKRWMAWGKLAVGF